MSDDDEYKIEAKSDNVSDVGTFESVTTGDIDYLPPKEIPDQDLYHSHSWWTTYVFSQDAKYIGLEPYNWVTAWLAITDANKENGCMRMWSGSHKEKIKEHKDTFNENNLLTRGQTVQNVPLEDTTPNILKAGQLSLHHPMIVHGSGSNKSNTRRIGFVIQSYIGTNVDQVIGKVYVQQARGKDNFKYHEHTKRPSELMNKEDINIRIKANNELSKIFYNDAKKQGKY